MLRRVVDNCGAVPEVTTGDAGYFSAANVLAAEHWEPSRYSPWLATTSPA